ncbi:MAG: hypothetical protein KGQ59_01930 [Bdellovibrionales bacterium]|nr:hypothetical protein [Bdellovibrionales bacterium]
MRIKPLFICGTLGLALLMSCGRNGADRSSGDGSPTVRGDLLVGTQCPFGTVSKAINAGVKLYNCKIGIPEIELSGPPVPIYLSADCAEKTLAVRTADGSVDTLWQTLPNGAFSLVIPGFKTKLGPDSSRNALCLSSLTMEISGQVDCRDRDILSIRVDTLRMWMKAPYPEDSAALQLPACQLPTGCRLETNLNLRQCG